MFLSSLEKLKKMMFRILYRRDEQTERIVHCIQDEYKYINWELLLNIPGQGKGILLAGFYGAYNLGDELMLDTLLSYLMMKKYGRVTVLLCDNDQYDYYDFPGVHFLHYPKRKFDYNIIAQQYDVLIWGGGALIDDARYLGVDERDISYLGNMFIDLSKRFIAHEKKCVVLGLSSNRALVNQDYIRGLKQIVEGSVYFSVRDTYSKKVLEDVGISGDQVDFLNDLVFGHKKWERCLKKVTGLKSSRTVRIGIVFICLKETEEMLRRVIEYTCKVCSELYGRDFEIVCIPFYHYRQHDLHFYELLNERYKMGEKVFCCPYPKRFEDIIEEMQKLDFLINMRYHAMLLSMVLKIPSLNICLDSHDHYYNKVKYITELGAYESSVMMYTDLVSEVLERRIEMALRERKIPDIDRNILLETGNQIEEILDRILTEEDDEIIDSINSSI